MRSKADATGVIVILVLREASLQSADGPFGADFVVRRHALRGQHIQGGDGLRTRQIGGDQKIEKGVDKFAQRLGLFIAVHHHNDVALRGLPQQHDVQRLGGGGESGERLARARVAQQPADGVLKRRVATERLKQIADRWMCHERTVAEEKPRGQFYFNVTSRQHFFQNAGGGIAGLERQRKHLAARRLPPLRARR